MTNEEELTKLNSNDYQKKVAEGIYQAILRAFLRKDTRNEQDYFLQPENAGKMKEIREILQDMNMEILSMKEAGIEAEHYRGWKDI